MVKLFALNILYKGLHSATWLKTAYDLQTISYFQRGSVQSFMAFASKTMVERTGTGMRQSVKEGEYMCHVFVRGDNLAGVVLSNVEYPFRVAHTMLTKVMDEFACKYPPNTWPSITSESAVDFPQINDYLAKFQNPREADGLTKIQAELQETKIILHETIGAVLSRGEKLEDLIMKSEELSLQSKAFYKTARKTNSCCSYVG